jgi:hypothetical protein
MGSVYRAHDPLRGGPVAIKLMHETQQHAADIERFEREAELLSELRHPGIVDYVAHGRTPDGQYYLAMEWLDGVDLAALLSKGRRLSVAESLGILVEASAAVASAHQRRVVHRDLKPSNLFLIGGNVDRVKVLDFGIARTARPSDLTRTGNILGTPDYMAPEQARGARQLTPAADVFALGCVLYECLTGRPPFAADQLAAVLTRILFEDPEPLRQRLPEIDPRISVLVERMLAKDLTARLPDAAAVSAELARLGTDARDPTLRANTPSSKRPSSRLDVDRGLIGVMLASAPSGGPQELPQLLAATGARWEWLLDGTLVGSVRGYDSAFDLAEQAARAALAVKEHWPEANVVLSIAVTASEKAADLQRSVADRPSNGVWLDELAAKLLGRRFELTSDKGAPVLRPGAARVDEDRPLLGRPTACVGREQELGAIEATLHGCIDDSEPRALLMLSGPGLGKSRLRHEFLRRLAGRNPEPLVLHGTADLASAGAPYGILRSTVRRLCAVDANEPIERARERLSIVAGDPHTACFVGELAGVPFPEDHHPALASARANPQIMQEQIHRAFNTFLLTAARQRPILIVLDDLQWGDALSVALVDQLLQTLTAPMLVLALARPEVHEAFPRLWHGRRVQEHTLPPLSRRASERLLNQVLGDRLSPERMARLIELAAGNPLYLEELARAAAEDPDAAVPETVIAMIEARIGRLPADPRQLLFLASVLGRTFVRDDLHALARTVFEGVDEVDHNLDRLVASELLARSATNEFSFRHALAREATYELLAEDERQHIHERAAEVLSRGADPNPLVIAEHSLRSTVPARAIPWLLKAAQAAFARCDLPSAMKVVQRALALGPKGAERGTLRAVEGLCLSYTGQMPVAALDEALELLPTGDTFWCMASHLRLTLTILTSGWSPEHALWQRFLAAEPTPDAIPEYVSGAGTLVSIFSHAGAPEPAHLLRKPIEAAAARRPGLPLVETWRIWVNACLMDVDGAPAADLLREIDRASDQYRGIANERTAFFCEGLASLVMAELGDRSGAVDRLRKAITQAEQLNEHYVRMWLSCFLALLLAEGPGWAEGLAMAEAIIALGVAPPCPDLALGIKARALLTAGRVAEAEEPARKGLDRFSSSPAFACVSAGALVETYARLGRREEAIAVGERWMQRVPPNTTSGSSRAALARALAQAQPPTPASAVTKR